MQLLNSHAAKRFQQLSVMGKGGRTRQVLLPNVVSGSLLALRGDASSNDPVFASHKGGRRLTERTVGYMLARREAGRNRRDSIAALAASRP